MAAGRWGELTLSEQLSHIGGEVSRALNWRAKHNEAYCLSAAERALELTDLTLAHARGFSKLKELARMRECLVDYFFGINEYGQSDQAWRRYFRPFDFAARKHL